MNIVQLHTLTAVQTEDLLGLMKELNPQIKVTEQMLQDTVQDPGTRLFAAIEPDGHIVGCATLCISHSPEHIIAYAQAEWSPILLHLTSHPTRVAANRLYQAIGFQPYPTNVYKLPI